MTHLCNSANGENPARLHDAIPIVERPYLVRLELPISSVRRLGVLSVTGGAHSDLYKGVQTRCGVDTLVAIKALRRNDNTRAIAVYKDFYRQAAIWQTLDHSNIAPLYGVFCKWASGYPALVLPWYENGTANEYLKKCPDADAISIIRGIAEGLTYMHEKGIVHGDLKGANVMVDDYGNARLIDFGLSHSIDADIDDDLDGHFVCGFTIRWCAPELFKPGAITTRASDVYAFASTILELLSRRVPYHNKPDPVVAGELLRGVPPSVESSDLIRLHCRQGQNDHEDMLLLLRSCWDKADLRPTMSQVRVKLMTYPSGRLPVGVMQELGCVGCT